MNSTENLKSVYMQQKKKKKKVEIRCFRQCLFLKVVIGLFGFLPGLVQDGFYGVMISCCE